MNIYILESMTILGASVRSFRAWRRAALMRTIAWPSGDNRRGLLLLAAAALLLIPALVHADVPVATISGPVSVAEGQTGGAVYTVTLEDGTGSEDIVFDYTVTGTVSQADYTDDATVDGKLTLTAANDGTGTPATGLITLQILDDGIDEVPETMIVTLTDVNTGAGTVDIGSPKSVTTTVLPGATNTVSFAATSVSDAEGGPLVFTANLATTVDVVVHYDIIPGTAARTDYDSASGNFTISPGSPGSGTFTITSVDDNLAEDAETFTARLRLVSPPANVALGLATETGTITDNDPIAATVTADQTTIVEGSDATFTVNLGNAGSEDVVVTYNTDTTTDNEPNADFEAPEGTLIIPAGQTMGTIAITTSGDDLVEGVEELRVTLDAADSGAGIVAVTTTLTAATATTEIGDPDSMVLVSVDDATTTEGEDAILIFRLSGKSSGPVTIPFGVGGGTATAGADYTDPDEDVVIPAGMTTRTITVSTEEDEIAEDTETFTVTLETLPTPPAGVRIGDTTATVKIRDANPLTVTVEGENQVRQGSQATFKVKVNEGMGSSPIYVDYTVGGTATKGVDYEDPDGTATILTNEDPAETTITIPTRQASEADETLVVTLTGVRTETGRVTLGAPRVARATFVSQDTVIISVPDATVTEGDTATASFVVSVDGDGLGAPKLRYETAPGTATAADYTAATGTQYIDIGADPTNASITVAITNDSLAEGDETFTLNLSLESAPDNVVLGTTSAKATISDDTGDGLSVSVASEEGSFAEGSEANFPVTLNGTSTADVVVPYTVAGIDPDTAGPKEAAEKEDYEVLGDSVTIPAGTNTATITVPIVADDLLEPKETLQVTLMSPTTAKGEVALDADNTSATTDIIPQAQDAVTASLATTAVTVTEGGKASFPVELSGKVADDLTFTYTLAPAAGADYTTATPAEVEIKAGETRAVIEVNTTPDTVAENTETFTLTLVLPTDRPEGLALGTAQATGMIRDNDPINVTVEGPDRVVAGGSGSYRFRLTGDTTANDAAAITVAYTTNGTPPSGDATIAAGQSVSDAESVTAGASGSLVVRVTEVTTDAGRVASGVGRTKSTQIRPATTTLVSIADSANVDEGDNATFAVTSTGAPATGPVTVSYQVSAGSASASDFRTPSERTVTVGQSISVPIVIDDVAEGAETFRVTLSNPRSDDSGDSVELGTTSAMATINPSDPLTAEVSSQDTTVLEGESATFVVDLGGTSSASVEIDYTVMRIAPPTPAEDEDDVSPEKGKLTIPAGRSTGTIQVEALDDDILEPAETVQVTLTGAAPANVVTVDTGNHTATTIIGANGSTVTASLATTAVTVTEGGKASFPVELSGKVASDLTFTYTLVPAAEADYTTATPAEVEIKAGETRAVIEVNTTPDMVAENTETFTLMLELPTDRPEGLALGTAEATGTITDNDPINVTVVGSDRVVAGGSGSYRFRLTGDTTASTAITVAYATNTGAPSASAPIPQDASESASFTVATGSLTSGSLVVRVTDVTTDAGRVASGVGRTKNTTILPDTTVLVSIADAANVDEGGDATFAVSSTGANPTGNVTVNYTVSAGSASSADFTTPSGTVTVGQNITVPTVDDKVAEGAETFRVTLSSPRSDNPTADPRVELGTASAMATINASDALTAEVSSQDTTVLEGESATFVVDLGGTSSSSVEIDYTVMRIAPPPTAEDKDDFSPEKGKLRVPAGQSTGTIQVEALDDDILEPAETLQVMLTGAAPANVVTVDTGNNTANNTATTIIGASDSPAKVSVADVTVDEGETAMIEVKLSKMVSLPVTVTHELAPASSTDYGAATPTNLVFMPGETAKTIEVPIAPDTLAEDKEAFTVRLSLSDPPAGVSLGRNPATVTITDDAVTVALSGDRTVNEGEAAEYTVSVSGLTGEDEIIVSFTVESDTATSQDYSPSSGTLTLNAEQMSQTFTIQTVDEPDVVDLREKLVVSITAETSEGDAVRTEGPITTTIVDDGTVGISVEADPEIVPESREEATFTVTLTGTIGDEPVTLDYRTADGTATAPADYTAANGTLTIAAGDSSAIITVAVNDDGLEELTDETFDLTLSAAALPEGVEIETATATVTVTDHTLQASVSAPATVNEGQSVTFTVSLTPAGQNRSGVTVDYELGGTAVVPGDYAAPASGTLTIPQGQTSGTIAIQTVSDGVLDPGETLSVTLTDVDVVGAGLASVDSGQATATVTLVDQQTVTWSVADIEVDENRDAVFTVTLDGPVQDGVTLTYATADGTATAGSDYTAVSNGQVTVAGGSTSATFTVQVTDDTNGEASETFTVRVTRSTAPAGVEPPSATATATIRDNDLALLPIADVTVTEGGQANIVLRLERALQEPVRIGYSTAGSATAEEDYTFSVPVVGLDLPLPRGAIEVPAGVQQGEVTVAAVDDSLAEGNEQITMTLTTVTTDGSAPAVLGQVMVTIEDNDELSVSVTAPKTVAEGDVARFTVKVGGGESTAPVNVSYSLGGTAKAPADYTAPSPTMVSIPAGQQAATIAIQTKADKVLEPDETLVVTLTEATTTAGTATVGSPKSATTRIQDPAYHSINRVNRTLLPGVMRASTASALEAIGWRMAEGAQGNPAATADLAGLTGLYRALQANEYTLQDGSYDLAKVLRGSSFLVPLSSHDDDSDAGIGFAVWGGGDFRTIAGGDVAAVEWGGSVWAARVGADLRFVDNLLTGIVISFASGALDYADATPRDDREGTYGTWLASVHPYVGWTTSDFGLWASVGFGRGGLTLDDSEADAQESDLTQWSVGAGGSVTLLSTDWFIAGGTTAVKLKADGFLATATVSESENKLLQELTVGVNQARAAIEASHAQHFAGGASLKPTLEIGGRFDGGDGETGAGLEVGGGLTYADPGAGLKVAATGRALVVRDGNYGEWGVSGLLQWDPDAAGHGLMMSVRPTFGVTASGVNGLWEHGTFDLLAGSDQPGGLVKAEIGYGLPAFGPAGAITPYIGASLTDAGDHSLSLGGRIELGQMMELGLEAERRESARGGMVEHDITLEGSVRW